MKIGELISILEESWEFNISKKDNKVIWIAQKNGMHFTSIWKGFEDHTDAIEDFLVFVLDIESQKCDNFISNTLLL